MIIDRDKTIDALSRIVNITEMTNLMPVLKCVKINFKTDVSTVTATNLNVTAAVTLPAVDTEETLVVNGKVFLDIVKALDKGDIELNKDKNILRISQGSAKYDLALGVEEDFPTIDTNNDLGKFDAFLIDVNTLLKLVRKVEFASSADETRYALCGIRLTSREGHLEVVATDGFRLSLVNSPSVPLENVPGVTIPRNALAIIKNAFRGGQVKVVMYASKVKFIGVDTTLICGVIEANYPLYEGLISTNGAGISVKVETAALMEAIRKSLIIGETKDHPIKAVLSGTNLVLKSESVFGNTVQIVPVEATTETEGEVAFNFNGRYLSDVLNRAEGSTISLKLLNDKVYVYDDTSINLVMTLKV